MEDDIREDEEWCYQVGLMWISVFQHLLTGHYQYIGISVFQYGTFITCSHQCRYICCDTIFRQKWKFDRHISSWWESKLNRVHIPREKWRVNAHLAGENWNLACDYKESLWDKVWYSFFQPWHVSQRVLRTKQVSLLASFCNPSWEKKFCCLLFLVLNYYPNFDKSCSILRASPGYYLRKTYHSCRYI